MMIIIHLLTLILYYFLTILLNLYRCISIHLVKMSVFKVKYVVKCDLSSNRFFLKNKGNESQWHQPKTV